MVPEKAKADAGSLPSGRRKLCSFGSKIHVKLQAGNGRYELFRNRREFAIEVHVPRSPNYSRFLLHAPRRNKDKGCLDAPCCNKTTGFLDVSRHNNDKSNLDAPRRNEDTSCMYIGLRDFEPRFHELFRCTAPQ